ncbi:molybdopterin molybdotransferase MoeA [Costertonia aggregata]|uniref:Molybdopterin molybdenumtransferase n=1 Tax=Costertonia aggregata TaxID=343403 RepID=A0A7H9AMX7_9FLAO|nr:gephyrin-like molybdotransferase Glp [Costertonia aggregata]QLG44635.1 molybdopterin molybdotransferase MoeA [Costertonia aggregata]
MISIEEALQLVIDHSPKMSECSMDIDHCEGFYLSKTIHSPIHMPPFRQSAVDGYALHVDNTTNYINIDEIKAGDSHIHNLEKGQAVRIFTGAAVPDSANAVVMQEHVKARDNHIIVEGVIMPQQNIRPKGEQVKKGGIALKAGTKLNAAAIGYLASLGITKVDVYKKPTIAIVVTGNELVMPGSDLGYGKIYESNSIMLSSALRNLGYKNITIFRVQDDYQNTKDVLQKSISEHDVVLVTGGISVGDYDFVGKALHELEVEQIFYKVRQKPGKPLFFGRKNHTTIFALPGNPAAALSCFYIYVYTVLSKISGNPFPVLSRQKMRSISDYIRKGDRPQFLKALCKDGTVEILEGQNSSMLQTFAVANALLYVSKEQEKIAAGDMVETIMLPK